jgi:hypothetical protein
MCTVTFAPRADRYLLAMNRDEQYTRQQGRAPVIHSDGENRAVHPSEPQGGTWISLNDRGVTLALVNWYEIQPRVLEAPISRGRVILTLRHAATASDVDAALGPNGCVLDLSSILPFRLIGVFPGRKQAREWRWDQRTLTTHHHPWTPAQWASSGHGESEAQRIRGGVFNEWIHLPNAGSREWIRSLHASHAPRRGPFSICMHRQDAMTVSYTETEVTSGHAAMRHQIGSPCQLPPMTIDALPLRAGLPPHFEA